MMKSVAATLVFALYALVLPLLAAANDVAVYDAPHYDPGNGYTCVNCHTPNLAFAGAVDVNTTGSAGYNNVCLSCHKPGDPKAGSLPFTVQDAANPFQNHSTSGYMYQSSHRWDGSDTVPQAGAQPPISFNMNPDDLRTRTGNGLACVRCHDPHKNDNSCAACHDPNYKPGPDGKPVLAVDFLRIANNTDQMCLDCHRSWNVSSHNQGSHPVLVNYSASAMANPDLFNYPPLNANTDNPSSDLGARLNQSGRQVLCTTCHGVHYTDSRSSTPDGSASFANLSASTEGFVLRTDRRGQKVGHSDPDNLNICTNCHANKSNHNAGGEDIQCSDCHGAHVAYDPNDPTGAKGVNLYLIRRNVTKGGNPSTIFFRYSGGNKEYKNAKGTGVCQGCHDVPAPGTGYAPAEHDSTDPNVCNVCHMHNNPDSSFSVPVVDGGCTLCHGDATTPGYLLTTGKHQQHVNNAATLGLNFGCVDCHAKTVSSNTAISNKANHQNHFVDYSGARAGGSATYDGTSKLCSAAYCHSDGKGTQIAPPAWNSAATLGCNGCHGADSGADTFTSQAGEPNYANAGAGLALANSHQVHIGLAPAPCVPCHANTVDGSNKLLASGAHINRAADISFSAVAGSNAGYAAGTKTCSNIACHVGSPVWGSSSAAVDCLACHPLTGLSNGHKYHLDLSGGYAMSAYRNLTTNRSAANYNFGCANCHPMTNLAHKNGKVMIDLRPADTDPNNQVSTLRSKNSPLITTAGAPGAAGTGTHGTSGASITCDNIYCHSNGWTNGTVIYATTPDWYVGYTGADECSMCHDNSPNSSATDTPTGSAAHNVHVVGIHALNVFDGVSGVLPAGATGNVGHGDPVQSTTLNCNICHSATVTLARNDQNTVCVTCHNNQGNPARIANKALHVNGMVDVVFANMTIVSKAQLRPDSFNAYTTIWTRNGGNYKNGASAYDTTKFRLSSRAAWDGQGGCSNVACHLGQPVQWTDTNPPSYCALCHKSL